MSTPRIRLIHPAIQPYRDRLFHLLEEELNFEFLFVGWYEHNQRYLSRVGLSRYELLPARGLGPYREGVSARLLARALRGDYDAWVSTTINWWPTHAAFPIVKSKRKPFLLWMEDWWWLDVPAAPVVRAYGRRILRGADALIVAGSRARDFAIDNGADPHKVFLAPNSTMDLGERPADKGEVERFRHEMGGDANFLFLFLNRVVAYKGLDVLIRAFAQVRRRIHGTSLAVIGEGPELEACKELALDLGVDGVRFLGAVPHERVHLAFRACDLYVHPARRIAGRIKAEAWGFTVNEAMSVETPVLATTAVASACDLIDDGTNGFIVEYGDVGALARRMIDAAEMGDELQDMGRRAQEKLQAGFRPKNQLRGFSEAIRASLGAAREQ